MDTGAQNGGRTAPPKGVADRMPQEFKDLIAAIETEHNGHLQTLRTHVNNAGAAHRETLRHLDSLLEGWGQRLQSQYEGVHQRYDGVQTQFESILQQLEASQRDCDGIRAENQSVLQQAQGLQQQFEATQQQCQVVLGYEQLLKGHIGKLADFARLHEEVDKLRTAATTSRRRQWLAVAASLLALLIAGCVGLGTPWPLFAGYVALWPPG